MNVPVIVAQAGIVTTVGTWMLIAIVVAGIVGIAIIVANKAGVQIPGFIIQILWVIFAVVIGVIAIKFLMSIF